MNNLWLRKERKKKKEIITEKWECARPNLLDYLEWVKSAERNLSLLVFFTQLLAKRKKKKEKRERIWNAPIWHRLNRRLSRSRHALIAWSLYLWCSGRLAIPIMLLVFCRLRWNMDVLLPRDIYHSSCPFPHRPTTLRTKATQKLPKCTTRNYPQNITGLIRSGSD